MRSGYTLAWKEADRPEIGDVFSDFPNTMVDPFLPLTPKARACPMGGEIAKGMM